MTKKCDEHSTYTPFMRLLLPYQDTFVGPIQAELQSRHSAYLHNISMNVAAVYQRTRVELAKTNCNFVACFQM